MNILLTCAGRRVALMDAFRGALARLGREGKILAADVEWASAAYHKADAGLTVPRTDSPDYLPALADIVRAEHVGLIVPTTDLDLLPLARGREALARMGCAAAVASEPTMALCRDKAAAARRLADAGLATPATVTLAAFREDPFYPCFVKPSAGSGSIGAAAIRNEAHLAAHLADHGEDLIVQECATGQEFTIDVYRDRGGQVRSVVPRQRLAVRSGEVEKAVTVRDEALIAAATRLAGAMDDLWGVFCCQCRREGPGAEVKFLEVNPRFGGGVMLSIAAGADLPLYLLQEVTGQPITAKAGAFTEGLLMLRYDQAAFVQVPPEDLPNLPGYDQPVFR